MALDEGYGMPMPPGGPFGSIGTPMRPRHGPLIEALLRALLPIPNAGAQPMPNAGLQPPQPLYQQADGGGLGGLLAPPERLGPFAAPLPAYRNVGTVTAGQKPARFLDRMRAQELERVLARAAVPYQLARVE